MRGKKCHDFIHEAICPDPNWAFKWLKLIYQSCMYSTAKITHFLLGYFYMFRIRFHFHENQNQKTPCAYNTQTQYRHHTSFWFSLSKLYLTDLCYAIIYNSFLQCISGKVIHKIEYNKCYSAIIQFWFEIWELVPFKWTAFHSMIHSIACSLFSLGQPW